MVIRYMGTKRHMVDAVNAAITAAAPTGTVVDLFAGMGSVAESMANDRHVITNDISEFAAAMSRARFTGRSGRTKQIAETLGPRVARQVRRIRAEFAEVLAAEEEAMRTPYSMQEWMEHASHVGNDVTVQARAATAAASKGQAHYRLATCYFAAGYFSTAQAIEIDAARCVIDTVSDPLDRDRLLAAWIAASSSVINAPGHTAQFLKVSDDRTHARISRTWRRSFWTELLAALERVGPVGSARWRTGNRAFNSDALELLGGLKGRSIGAVYADPPYTKDQYSRYYHVFETLYKYDFPQSSGAGRYRHDRSSTGFSVKSQVLASMHDLFRSAARLNSPLVLSYPDNGLLHQTGHSVEDVARTYYRRIARIDIEARHSTLGASNGASKKPALEQIYACT